jgi:hypothetical protein
VKLTAQERKRMAQAVREIEDAMQGVTDPRSQHLFAMTVAGTAIAFLAQEFGTRNTFEWLRQIADDLEKEARVQ